MPLTVLSVGSTLSPSISQETDKSQAVDLQIRDLKFLKEKTDPV